MPMKEDQTEQGNIKHKKHHPYWFKYRQLQQIFLLLTNNSRMEYKFQALLSMLQVLRPSKIGWRPCPLLGTECIYTSPTSAFIFQTYPVSHKEVLLCLDSDSHSDSHLGCHHLPSHAHDILINWDKYW